MPRATAKADSVSSSTQKDERPVYFIQSLERGFQILRAFDREHPSMTVSEVASRTGLTRGTAQRFLLTLADLGYAEQNGKRFGLRPKVLDLGFAYLASNDVWDTVEPFVEEVVNELNESCTVGVLDWPDIVYVCRVQARRVVNAALSVGSLNEKKEPAKSVQVRGYCADSDKDCSSAQLRSLLLPLDEIPEYARP